MTLSDPIMFKVQINFSFEYIRFLRHKKPLDSKNHGIQIKYKKKMKKNKFK